MGPVKLACALAFLPLLAVGPLDEEPSKLRVALVPLSRSAESQLQIISPALKRVYGVEVLIAQQRKMPTEAYYEPRRRYRAEKILRFLEDLDLGKVDKVLAVASVDISATVGKQFDWGVIGYAGIGERACVISTHRLGRDPAKLPTRIQNSAIHEFGHTLGLDHCESSKKCPMQDYKRGAKRILDELDLTLCKSCRKQISGEPKRA